MNILLIDGTFYYKKIDETLKEKKLDYFKIKKYIRDKYLGKLDNTNAKSFSQGLLRIATLLKRANQEVTFMSLEELKDNDNDINIKINNNEFDIICFGAVTPTVPLCETFCLSKKALGVKSKFIIGGAHVNEAKKLTQERHPNFDQYVAGYEKDAVEQILGYHVDNSILNGDYVDYSLLPHPISEYAINNLFTASGCSFNCEYCADHRMPYIENSLTGGYERISSLLDPMPRLIHFFDSNIGYRKDRLLNVCTELSKIKHNNIFSCNMRPELLDEEVCEALYKARFREIMIGLENADENILKKNSKQMSLSSLEKKLQMLKEYVFFVTAYTMVGMPFSTKETLDKTIERCKYYIRNGLITDCKIPAIYVPYPRDDFDYKELGVKIDLDKGWEHYDRASYPVYNLESDGHIITAEEIWDANLKLCDVIIQELSVRERIRPKDLNEVILQHLTVDYGISDDGSRVK